MSTKNYSVRAIERALDILNHFNLDRLEMSLTEISLELKLPLSTTSRIATTLERKGFLSRNESNQKYYIGPAIMHLSNCIYKNIELRQIALPYMKSLRDEYNESVSLYVVQGTERVCIERIETSHSLRRVINIGEHFPLTRGAAGRVLLAYLPIDKAKSLIEKDPYTSFKELEKIRSLGYTVSHGERDIGVVSIAAPIFNAHKEVIAAIAITWPSIRFEESQLPEIISKVKEYAKKISTRLGFSI